MATKHICSSLVFGHNNESPIYDEKFTIVYDVALLYFGLYAAPVLGIVNVLSIFVLTRKEMLSPYNIVFISMALNQSLSVFGRVIVLWRTYLNIDSEIDFSLAWRVFEMGVAVASLIFSSHVSWLAVIITFVRWRHLKSSSNEPSMRYMILLCSLSFVAVVAASVPLFLSIEIQWLDNSVPVIAESAMTYAQDCLLLRITYFSMGVLFSALPCILLLLLSIGLIIELRKIQKNHAELAASGSCSNSADSSRSTTMIAIIVISTLLTDIPQAIISILVGILSDHFRSSIANKLSSLMITMVMITSSCNLTIHLCMSKRFREVTKSYLCFACNAIKRRKRITPMQSNEEVKKANAVETFLL